MQKNIIITLLLSIIIALFAILNAAAIPVNLIFTTIDISAALVILISATIGAIIVYSMDAVTKMKLKKICKDKEKLIVVQNEELVKLREAKTQNEHEIIRLKAVGSVQKPSDEIDQE